MKSQLALFSCAIAAAFAAPVTAQAPQLTLEQSAALRCSAAFALVAEGQANGNAEALAFPPLATRGREFFVRTSARIMDETGRTREQVAAMLQAEAQKLWDEDMIGEVMPGCMLLLDASGV
ncbi:MAG: hypothetical protein H6913_00415 [Altererythrobacter sp.]|nr:hypothetical protein [Altererythrobacter sp.]